MADFEGYKDPPQYQAASEITWLTLYQALCNLSLFGDDSFLRMQASNLAIIDQWLTQLEYDLLHKLMEDERTPALEATFVSAQSQMWIFAAYELMRTWRQRAREVVKWAGEDALTQKLATFEDKQESSHFGRDIRASQIRDVIADPSRVKATQHDLKRTYIPFRRVEAIRVSLAKHEVWKNKNSVALRPGYGRINSECGALDYEIENEGDIIDYISRRDIADDIRARLADDHVPSEKEIAAFDESMRLLRHKAG